MGKLEGKTAVVTGASSGIGLAVARRFVDEGAFVYMTGRRLEPLSVAAQSIGRNVKAVRADISNLADLDQLYTTIAADSRRIDALVANAGIVELVPSARATPEHFDKIFGINARGTFFTVQKAFPLLADEAAIVLVSSAGHLKGIPPYATYAATKAAIRSFARSWAAELKDRQIRVNVLSPGSVDTPIIEAQWGADAVEARRASIGKMMPLGRLGTVTEMASAVLFLASSESSYCTGSELVADGGFTQL